MGQNDIRREVAFGGQRVRQKMILALTLSSVIPLLILTYCFYAYLMPLFDGARPAGGDGFAVPILLLFTALLMAGGGYVIYDLATALSRAAHIVTEATPDAAPVIDRQDEIGTLVASFSKMMATIEQQAQEINHFPQKLDQLTRQAFQDPLTALPNRALFMDRLAHALARTERRAQHVAVLFLDIDRFKVINDSLGHAVGDQALGELSRRLRECVRPEDTIARLGGDEFAILLEDLDDLSGATAVAERVGKALETPFLLEGREVVVTMSVGVALNTRRPVTPEELLRDADLAMYRAKGKGKNRYEVFDTDTAAPAIHRLDLELDLRSAVARDELRLHYQPVVHLETGQVEEFEALVRWQHKDRGLLPPDAFIGPHRGDRAHHPDRPVGAHRGVPTGAAMAGAASERAAAHHRRQPLGAPAAGPRPGQPGLARPEGQRSRCAEPQVRDHRERGHAGCSRDAGHPARPA
jgi:diguanylate cyclase (GGDEF)-like protein